MSPARIRRGASRRICIFSGARNSGRPAPTPRRRRQTGARDRSNDCSWPCAPARPIICQSSRAPGLNNGARQTGISGPSARPYINNDTARRARGGLCASGPGGRGAGARAGGGAPNRARSRASNKLKLIRLRRRGVMTRRARARGFYCGRSRGSSPALAGGAAAEGVCGTGRAVRRVRGY